MKQKWVHGSITWKQFVIWVSDMNKGCWLAEIRSADGLTFARTGTYKTQRMAEDALCLFLDSLVS